MSLSPELAAIWREECRKALGRDISPSTVGQDLASVLGAMPPHEARVFASRIHDAALEYLVEMDPVMAEMKVHGVPAVPEPEPDPEPELEIDLDPEPDPNPAPTAPSEPDPEPEPAPADAVGSEEVK